MGFGFKVELKDNCLFQGTVWGVTICGDVLER